MIFNVSRRVKLTIFVRIQSAWLSAVCKVLNFDTSMARSSFGIFMRSVLSKSKVEALGVINAWSTSLGYFAIRGEPSTLWVKKPNCGGNYDHSKEHSFIANNPKSDSNSIFNIQIKSKPHVSSLSFQECNLGHVPHGAAYYALISDTPVRVSD